MMLRPDGSLDDSFNGDGVVELPAQPSDNFSPTYVVNAVVNQGHLLVLATDGGNNEAGGGTEGLYQYNLNGTLDTTFGSGGMIANPVPGNGGHDDPSLVLLPGGQVPRRRDTLLKACTTVSRKSTDTIPTAPSIRSSGPTAR